MQVLGTNLMGAADRDALRKLGLSGGRVVAAGHQGEKPDEIFRVQDANGRDINVPASVAAALLKRINEQYGEAGEYRIDDLYRGEGISAAERPQRSEFASQVAFVKALVAWEKARGFAPGQQR